jgi:hypothetical protein
VLQLACLLQQGYQHLTKKNLLTKMAMIPTNQMVS